MGRSDTCRQLQCVDMFVKVVDMVMGVKNECHDETLHKIEVLDPAALQSQCIPSANELTWCDATSVTRAIRIGRAAIQSTCKTKQFFVKRMDWLHKFTLQGKDYIQSILHPQRVYILIFYTCRQSVSYGVQTSLSLS